MSPQHLDVVETIQTSSCIPSYVILKVYLDPSLSEECRQQYRDHIQSHNTQIQTNPFPDAGFDLLVPEDIVFPPHEISSVFVSMGIKIEMSFQGNPCGCMLYPRSSISKTPLLLANHTGILDMGYRGWIIGAFRNLSNTTYHVSRYTRLVQLCHPSLCPMYVELIEDEQVFSTTLRGQKGFGSTG
jgi:dUTP pyrophosphatase